MRTHITEDTATDHKRNYSAVCTAHESRHTQHLSHNARHPEDGLSTRRNVRTPGREDWSAVPQPSCCVEGLCHPRACLSVRCLLSAVCYCCLSSMPLALLYTHKARHRPATLSPATSCPTSIFLMSLSNRQTGTPQCAHLPCSSAPRDWHEVRVQLSTKRSLSQRMQRALSQRIQRSLSQRMQRSLISAHAAPATIAPAGLQKAPATGTCAPTSRLPEARANLGALPTGDARQPLSPERCGRRRQYMPARRASCWARRDANCSSLRRPTWAQTPIGWHKTRAAHARSARVGKALGRAQAAEEAAVREGCRSMGWGGG